MQASDVRDVVEKLRAHAGTLWREEDEEIVVDGGSLLPELASLDALVEVLRVTRLNVLRHERRIGVSWRQIQDATGVHASTWRFRHNKGVLGS